MDMSVRPPRVLTRSFPLMTVPYTAGAPCSYWTLTCLAVSSALHSLMGFLFVSPVVCSRLPSDSTSRWTPLPFSYPFPTAGQGRDFHPIERAPAGRTKKIPEALVRISGIFLCAGGGNRTHTALLPTDFESASSTSSDTPAGIAAVNAKRIVTYMDAKCKRTAFYSPNIFRYSGEKSSVAK